MDGGDGNLLPQRFVDFPETPSNSEAGRPLSYVQGGGGGRWLFCIRRELQGVSGNHRGGGGGWGGGAVTLVISSPPFKVRKVLYYLGALLYLLSIPGKGKWYSTAKTKLVSTCIGFWFVFVNAEKKEVSTVQRNQFWMRPAPASICWTQINLRGGQAYYHGFEIGEISLSYNWWWVQCKNIKKMSR